MTQFEFVLVSSRSNISGSGTNRPISRYRRHYDSKVNRSIKKRKQDVIAFVNTVTQFIHRGRKCLTAKTQVQTQIESYNPKSINQIWQRTMIVNNLI
jgi:hypothetical protein